MTNRLALPDDLNVLIEKREEDDRREAQRRLEEQSLVAVDHRREPARRPNTRRFSDA